MQQVLLDPPSCPCPLQSPTFSRRWRLWWDSRWLHLSITALASWAWLGRGASPSVAELLG